MNDIDEALKAAAINHPVPGLVAAAVVDGALFHASAHGVGDAASQAPMTVDAVFRLYSMTKAITSAAVMQLVERDVIDLDQPAGRYAPSIDQMSVLTGFDGAGAPVLRPPKRPITVRRLLTHTSGFGYTMWNADLTRYVEWADRMKLDRGPNPLLSLPLVFDPGDKWEYGVGVDWAGRIIENMTGQGLDIYLKNNITGPLGMEDTAFAPTPSMLARLAGLYRRDQAGELVATPRPAPGAPPYFSGGGGLLGTALDYLKFLTAIAGTGSVGGVSILKPGSVSLMAEMDLESPPPRKLATSAPMITRDLDVWEGGARWSLAFLVNPEPGANGRSAGSIAWAGLNNTYYWVDRRRHLAAVFMTQLLPFVDANVQAVLAAYERALYRALK